MSDPATLQTPTGPMPAFETRAPAFQTIPFVFCSPHSGRAYPESLLAASRLSASDIRRSEDLFVDHLFDFVPAIGAPFLVAHFPRAYLDVNREPYELDPRMFREPLPPFVNSSSVRVAGGLGTIPRIVAEREEIYAEKLALAEGLERIERIYKPFHRSLESLIRLTRERFGTAIVIDCHSMPGSVRAMPGGRRPDFVVGDRFGTSASGVVVAQAIGALAALGYDVMRNKPYAGGYITERYGRPEAGIHVVQIEVNRYLYADEKRFEPNRNFLALRDDLMRFAVTLAAAVDGEFNQRAAAE
ncbi:N-formylglutamate amidohydrolase [Aureimonas endophytica]|uniref:N-formylglutamate amidohydrolase n=1 Tax=Aureimonas endophytica TaxID=2027858 RepID=A0A916ZKN9_9HYPH|nr:N-formylglutamate amidohydrolase [Aureimonas endophytica]GGE01225.1 N-formylglutamate amidohydrolase [Aureimonas endophytica]